MKPSPTARKAWALFPTLGAATVLLLTFSVATPVGGQATNPTSYKVGDAVAMPAGYSDKWLEAVVIEVDPKNATFPYRVHPLGYTPYADGQYMAKQLRPKGAVATQPIGGIVDDPYLLAAKGKTAYKPTQLVPGAYECVTLSNGHLVSAAILNFTILDGSRYRDLAGTTSAYRFDPGTGAVVFEGGALKGQSAKYSQASNPPVKSQPPQVTLEKSGDSCQLRM